MNISKATLISTLMLLVINLTGCSDDNSDESNFSLQFSNNGELKRYTVLSDNTDTSSVSKISSALNQKTNSATDDYTVLSATVLSELDDGTILNPLNGYVIRDAIQAPDRLIFTITEDHSSDVSYEQDADGNDLGEEPPLTASEYKAEVGCKIFQVLDGESEISCFSNEFDNDTLYLPLGIYHEGFYFLYVNEAMYRIDPTNNESIALTGEGFRLLDMYAKSNTVLFINEGGASPWLVTRNALSEKSEIYVEELSGQNSKNPTINSDDTVISYNDSGLSYTNEDNIVGLVIGNYLFDSKSNDTFHISENKNIIKDLNAGEIYAQISDWKDDSPLIMWGDQIVYVSNDCELDETCQNEVKHYDRALAVSNTICTVDDVIFNSIEVVDDSDSILIKTTTTNNITKYCGVTKLNSTHIEKDELTIDKINVEAIIDNSDTNLVDYEIESEFADISSVLHPAASFDFYYVLSVTVTLPSSVDMSTVASAISVRQNSELQTIVFTVIDGNKVTLFFNNFNEYETSNSITLDKTMLLNKDGSPIEYEGSDLIVNVEQPIKS
jgi:hypothetical protein